MNSAVQSNGRSYAERWKIRDYALQIISLRGLCLRLVSGHKSKRLADISKHFGIYDISTIKIRHNLRLMSGLSFICRIETAPHRSLPPYWQIQCIRRQTLSVVLRNGKRAARFSRSNDLRRERLVITLDNGRARDNPCKYAKPSNCKQSNLNVTLAAADVYLSRHVSTCITCLCDR